MKISTASKKVLASALSAAMVVAFAPTVAFGADATGGATLSYVDKAGATKTATYDTVQKAVDEAAKANGTKTVVTLAGNATVDSDLDIAGVADGLTLDLAGYTLSASQEFYEGDEEAYADEFAQIIDIAANGAGTAEYSLAQYTSTGDEFLLVKGTATGTKKASLADVTAAGQYVILDGEVYVSVAKTGIESGTAGYFQRVQKISAAGTTGKVTIKNGTISTFKAAEDYVGVKAAAPVVLDGVTIAAEDGQRAVDGTDVTVKGESKISSTGKVASAEGVVAVFATTSATVEGGEVSAANTGTGYATAVSTGAFTGKGGALKSTSAADNASSAAVYASGAAAVTGGTYEAAYTGTGKATNVKAAYLTGATTISAGDFKGAINVPDDSVMGGTFSADLKTTLKDKVADHYLAADDGTTSTVYKRAGFTAYTNGTDTYNVAGAADDAAAKVADAVMGNAAAGDTVAYTLGEGFTAEQVKAILTDNAKSALVRVAVSSSAFAAKDAKTDAQKAALAAASEAAAKTMDKVDTVHMLSAEIQYRAAGEREYATIATITDLGSSVEGRNAVANYVTVADGENTGDRTKSVAGPKISFLANGNLTAVEQSKKDEQAQKQNNVTALGIYAETSVDEDAIKDGISKPETPAEKATQSIDVAQKSKTVKLAKGKTKTQKAVSFKLGASAETTLTIAKKSGNSKISVSGQKITLKKGTKKGTFTAKVSLKAAASDEYLAAAKTITVKFVVKK